MPTVRVGNVAYHTTENDLREFFSQVGNVTNARIEYDNETGRHMGFGFVDYSDDEEAETAVNRLNGQDFMGRSLQVSFA